jgi:hypothetical protein
MSVRYRWFRVTTPRQNRDLRSLLLRHPLSDLSAFGFGTDNNSDGPEDFRFLWRGTVVVTRFDDKLSPVFEQIASLNCLKCSLISVNRMAFLRVENPGRNLRDLMNALEAVFGLGFSCEAVTFDKMPRSNFLGEGVDSARLVGLRIVGSTEGEMLVRMDFVSKKKLVLKDLTALDGIRYQISHAVLECQYKSLTGQISIASGGLVRFTGGLSPRLINLFERELPVFARRSRDDGSES